MIRSLNIAVADRSPDTSKALRSMLRQMGHCISCPGPYGTAPNTGEIFAKPDLLVAHVESSRDPNLEVMEEYCEAMQIPVVLIADEYLSLESIHSTANWTFGCLVEPVHAATLKAAIDIACRRFSDVQALRHQSEESLRRLEERKAIERAKGLLMQQGQLDESTAFRRLRTLARNNNRTMADIAQSILTTADALGGKT